jgi:DNA-binding ferritin-like protein (Dps family)
LPADYQAAWEQIKVHLFPHAGFTGRNLMPILDGALGLLEETAADGQDIHEVLGDDIKGFCAALAGGEGARSYRDRWREQLNRNVARKLGRLGG